MSDEVKSNSYDDRDMVRREMVHSIGATDERTGYRHNIKIAAYRVRDPETDEFSSLQFHMTMDNTVFAVMPQSAAEMFVRFVGDALAKVAAR